jgi:polyferredoxin
VQVIRRIFRPRVLIYSAVLVALSAAMIASLVLREPLKVDVIRDRAALAHRGAASWRTSTVCRS